MSERLINPARTCAVTGHRVLDKGFDSDNLKQVFIKVIEAGYDTFLIGMALGFDTLCFQTLYELRGEFNIKLVACIPCENQDLKFKANQKKTYEDMLLKADEKIFVSNKYTSTCMQKRNEFMVNHASLLVCYLRRDFGGTFKTKEYAKNKDIIIIDL